MSHPLDGVRLKVRQAEKHLDLLREDVEKFINSDPYSFSVKPDVNSSQYLIYAKINHIPPIDWSASVGDFAHNARSALNLLAFQLSSLPVERRNDIQFPISERAFENKYEKKILAGISERHKNMIKNYQPYQRGIDYENDPMYILSDINNTDKHRVIQLVGAATKFTGITFDNPVRFLGITFQNIQFAGGFDLANQGEDPIMRVVEVNGGAITKDDALVAKVVVPQDSQAQMRPRAIITIHFANGSTRACGRPLLDTLSSILDRVKEIVAEFEPEFT